MKTIAIGSFFVLFALVAGFTATAPVFADHATATVSLPPGSSVPGCEETNECYIPYEVTVDVGGEVTWVNDDSAAHTVTSGTPADGPDGVFDSSLFMAGAEFSHKFENAGTFDYFCMVHPWMEGIVTVQAAGAEDDLMVTVMDSQVKGGTEIKLEFNQKHVNYDITAKQNGNIVYEEKGIHAMETTATHMINALGSDKNPINVEVVSLGVGIPGQESDWTGPTGVVATAKVVPEFGTIAALILAAAIISIVAFSAKSKLSIIPRY